MDKKVDTILGLLMGVLLIPYFAFVAQTLWGWFITPTFSIPVPSLLVMVGLSITVGLFFDSNSTSENKSVIEQAVYLFSKYSFALLFGFFTQLFI